MTSFSRKDLLRDHSLTTAPPVRISCLVPDAFFCCVTLSAFINEIINAPSALLSYNSTREFLRTREKCREALAEGECF